MMRHGVRHLQTSDPVLAEVIERVGPFRMRFREPDFATLARAIVFQQLSGKAAGTIYGRLETLAPVTPEGVHGLSDEQLRGAGLSSQKLRYLRDLSEKTRAGALEFHRLPGMNDDEVIDHLVQVKGVGEWTAHMFLMFALRRPDVLPTGDLGIQNAVKKLYRVRKLTPERMEKIARPWRPYATVACWYLWRSLESDPNL
jgi:DNA-3-methyladenine glycosylase II